MERVVSDTKGALVEAQHLGEQVSTQRALLLQIRRMQALETMRLADVQVREVADSRVAILLMLWVIIKVFALTLLCLGAPPFGEADIRLDRVL